jgi:hypothetical protein
MTHDAHLIPGVGVVLAAGVSAAGLAARLRLPALVLFAGLGMLVGSDAVLLSAALQGAAVQALAARLWPDRGTGRSRATAAGGVPRGLAAAASLSGRRQAQCAASFGDEPAMAATSPNGEDRKPAHRAEWSPR